MSPQAGRSCPLRYRYGAEALARLPTQNAETLYVIGGLYGNLPALAEIEAMAAAEPGAVDLVFNGDFNWFNVDDAGFAEINRHVLAHHASLGNVEAELGGDDDTAGCGCAYPENVDAGTVDRSNEIHRRLKQTAARHPEILAALAGLPMTRRFQVGDCRIGIVHGDADSLAGWGFDVAALDDPANQPWLNAAFVRSQVDVFAGSHTCLPALRQFPSGIVINNGAAGMPNFRGQPTGLLTRISLRPPVASAAMGICQRGIYIHALPVAYDQAGWQRDFLANWPSESPAWLSYYRRITDGPDFTPDRFQLKGKS
jgi:hypothetical protein